MALALFPPLGRAQVQFEALGKRHMMAESGRGFDALLIDVDGDGDRDVVVCSE